MRLARHIKAATFEDEEFDHLFMMTNKFACTGDGITTWCHPIACGGSNAAKFQK